MAAKTRVLWVVVADLINFGGGVAHKCGAALAAPAAPAPAALIRIPANFIYVHVYVAVAVSY